MEISKIQRVALREVWRHEAHGLTRWLEENIDVVADVTNLQLSNVEREQAAGSFSVDLVAEDAAGNVVIIENQLGRSDHDHLGKLLTYLVAFEARTAIWIVAEPRPEHVSAVAWLNESSSGSFFLLKIEAIRIADSPAAPLLTLIVGPSEEAREVGKTKQERAQRYTMRHRFWTVLLERAKRRTLLHANISPGEYSWIGASAGRQGVTYNYSVRKHDITAELYVAPATEEESKTIFNRLRSDRAEIERQFGSSLEWDEVEGRRACRLKAVVALGGYQDEDKWSEIHEGVIDAMIRLERAVGPYLRKALREDSALAIAVSGKTEQTAPDTP